MGSPNAGTLPGEVQTPGAPPVPNFPIKCTNAPAGNDQKMSPCEKQQICAKCGEINKLHAEDKLVRTTFTKKFRKDATDAAKLWKTRLGNSTRGVGEYGKKIAAVPPADLKKNFAHDCAHEEWINAGADPTMPNLSGDHVHEIQLGGAPTDPSNFKVMSSKANEWVGRTLQDYDPKTHGPVAPDCC